MNKDCESLREEIEELREQIENLHYKLNLVYESKYYPTRGVFYELGFTEEKERKFYDILDQFMSKLENGESFRRYELEHALSDIGIGYQSLKDIFLALWEESRYIPVIVAYLKDMMKTFGSVASEYHKIWKEIEEKKL